GPDDERDDLLRAVPFGARRCPRGTPRRRARDRMRLVRPDRGRAGLHAWPLRVLGGWSARPAPPPRRGAAGRGLGAAAADGGGWSRAEERRGSGHPAARGGRGHGRGQVMRRLSVYDPLATRVLI